MKKPLGQVTAAVSPSPSAVAHTVIPPGTELEGEILGAINGLVVVGKEEDGLRVVGAEDDGSAEGSSRSQEPDLADV